MNAKEIILSNLYGEQLWDKYGELAWALFAVALLFVLFGLMVKWYIEVKTAIKKNTETPEKWDWRYFIIHNLFKKSFSILANIIIAIAALRFCTELFNIPVSMGAAFAMGIGFDEVIKYVSRWQGKLKFKP